MFNKQLLQLNLSSPFLFFWTHNVPQNTLAVRNDLDISIKDSLKEALSNMHNDPDGLRI